MSGGGGLTLRAHELAILLASSNGAVDVTGEHAIGDVSEIVVGLDVLLDVMAAVGTSQVSRRSSDKNA